MLEISLLPLGGHQLLLIIIVTKMIIVWQRSRMLHQAQYLVEAGRGWYRRIEIEALLPSRVLYNM